MDYYEDPALPEDGRASPQMGMTADWVSGFGEILLALPAYTADGTTVFQDDYVAENLSSFPADG